MASCQIELATWKPVQTRNTMDKSKGMLSSNPTKQSHVYNEFMTSSHLKFKLPKEGGTIA